MTTSTEPATNGRPSTHVVIVGGGFAGLGCARKLAGEDGVRVTLIDQRNYHQFQPLLYQVATSQLAAADIAASLRKTFTSDDNVDVKLAKVTGVDPSTHSVTTAQGETYTGDVLVLAAGAQANYFNTPGAAEHTFPLYSLADAERLRTRILTIFEDADRDPTLIDRGALNFVIVGAGATGTELAGAMADMINETMPVEYHDLAVDQAKVYVVDLGHVVLNGFSDKAHAYASKVLEERGVKLKLGTGVKEVAADHVRPVRRNDDPDALRGLGRRSDGQSHRRPPAACRRGGAAGIDVKPDLTVDGYPGVYVVGDIANIPDPTARHTHNSGRWRCRAASPSP